MKEATGQTNYTGSRAGIFITGGSGFLGRSLVPVVTSDRARAVFVLSRDQNRALEKLPPASNLQRAGSGPRRRGSLRFGAG